VGGVEAGVLTSVSGRRSIDRDGSQGPGDMSKEGSHDPCPGKKRPGSIKKSGFERVHEINTGPVGMPMKGGGSERGGGGEGGVPEVL